MGWAGYEASYDVRLRIPALRMLYPLRYCTARSKAQVKQTVTQAVKHEQSRHVATYVVEGRPSSGDADRSLKVL